MSPRDRQRWGDLLPRNAFAIRRRLSPLGGSCSGACPYGTVAKMVQERKMGTANDLRFRNSFAPDLGTPQKSVTVPIR